MFVIGQGKKIELRDTATGKICHTIGDGETQIESLAFSPDGRSLLVGESYCIR